MKYESRVKYPYVQLTDYAVTPNGEVYFRNKDLPEEIKQRLIEDVRKDWDRRMHPSEDKPLLDFET